uniref:ERp29 domain-containing protein n=1 Tax=Globodera pallida TaxID=36090 RepID=A0A183CEV1_GLOPA
MLAAAIILPIFFLSEVYTTTNRFPLQRFGGQLSEANSVAAKAVARDDDTVKQPPNDLFRAYMSRGMFTCGAKYVGTLQTLKRLIEDAHEEYSQCEKLMERVDSSTLDFGKSKLGVKTQQMATFNEVLD